MRSHLEPLRVLPEWCLPADSLLPGHIPAQDARCASEGNRLISGPISASSTSAVRRLTPSSWRTLPLRRMSASGMTATSMVAAGDETAVVISDPPCGPNLGVIAAPRQRWPSQAGCVAATARPDRGPTQADASADGQVSELMALRLVADPCPENRVGDPKAAFAAPRARQLVIRQVLSFEESLESARRCRVRSQLPLKRDLGGIEAASHACCDSPQDSFRGRCESRRSPNIPVPNILSREHPSPCLPHDSLVHQSVPGEGDVPREMSQLLSFVWQALAEVEQGLYCLALHLDRGRPTSLRQELLPFLPFNRIERHDLPDAVHRLVLIVEHALHEVLLASQENVTYVTLVLKYRAHHPRKVFVDLNAFLKFVQDERHPLSALPGNRCRQRQECRQGVVDVLGACLSHGWMQRPARACVVDRVAQIRVEAANDVRELAPRCGAPGFQVLVHALRHDLNQPLLG